MFWRHQQHGHMFKSHPHMMMFWVFKGSISWRTNTCRELGCMAAAVTESEHVWTDWSRRNTPMNYTSFKKLLRFSLETYFLSAQEAGLVEEICSWDCCHGYRGALYLHKGTFSFCVLTWKWVNNRSDPAQSPHSSGGSVLIIEFVFWRWESPF